MPRNRITQSTAWIGAYSVHSPRVREQLEWMAGQLKRWTGRGKRRDVRCQRFSLVHGFTISQTHTVVICCFCQRQSPFLFPLFFCSADTISISGGCLLVDGMRYSSEVGDAALINSTHQNESSSDRASLADAPRGLCSHGERVLVNRGVYRIW